ncbi:MAG: DEAD/DEAH box helicase [Pseudobdellovibrionaceae bacterium]
MQLNIRPSGTFHISDPANKIESEFSEVLTHQGVAQGLLFLDTHPDLCKNLPELNYWLDFVRLFLNEFCALPELESRIKTLRLDRETLPPPLLNPEDLSRFLRTQPLSPGSEYINEGLLSEIWRNLHSALLTQIIDSKQSMEEFFASRHNSVTLQGRLWFHLAENKADEENPFAFLATYSNKISEIGKTQHLPLGRALEEYSAKKDKQILMRLLAPLHKASKDSSFLKSLIDSNEVYHPQMWTPREAFKFLKDIPYFEKAGILVRVPNWWKPKSPPRPQVTVSLGNKEPKGMGLEALLDFKVSMNIGDLELSPKELKELLAKKENLVFFKGHWVEVDAEKLGQVLNQWKQIEKGTEKNGLTFLEGMRMLSGLSPGPGGAPGLEDAESAQWRRVETGPWLEKLLSSLKSPEHSLQIAKVLKKELKAELRPYQIQGVYWMYFLDQLKLGACLADDMGLGKTIQIISLLLLRSFSSKLKPNLLVLPASLLGNWKSELTKFAPSLQYFIAHTSEEGLKEPARLKTLDLVITTYGSLPNVEWLKNYPWGLVILDEAQAIKNPDTKQAKVIKKLHAENRFVLTGTPIENSVGDLWSLFDFIAPGLLGSGGEFSKFIKSNSKNQDEVTRKYGVIRKLVQPYILWRLKTDKSIIKDLPDKTELKTYCTLTKAQIYLYQDSVQSLARALEQADGMKRRGLILSYMMRFKQICNHPSHWLKDGEYKPASSGKFARLTELIEVIKAKQEKLLVFTQFQEMTEPLSDFLTDAFGEKGLVLHGGTPIGQRKKLVESFQQEEGPPYFVLSLKAGGTGLNLTQASHVIHFDRWWNPAIENQATDRAFRIGQKRNVMVHKFICQGTLEDKIDALIESKLKISKEVVGEASGGEMQFTEMSNSELINLVSLDLKHSEAEGFNS